MLLDLVQIIFLFQGYQKRTKHICGKLVPFVHLYSLKNLNNNHGGVLTLVKLQTLACKFTKSKTPLWVFSRFENCTSSTKLRKASHTWPQQLTIKSAQLLNHYKDDAFSKSWFSEIIHQNFPFKTLQ